MNQHSHKAQTMAVDCIMAARKSRKFDRSWKDFQPIENTRIGYFFERLFLRFCIAWRRIDVAIYSESENQNYLHYLKRDLAEFEAQLHRLEVRHSYSAKV